MEKPFYQILFIRLTWILAGFIALGTFLDAISNAITLITPSITYVGTILISVTWLIAELRLRSSLVTWSTENSYVTIKKLGWQVRLPLIGMILLLWVPRFISGYGGTSDPLGVTDLQNPTQTPRSTSTSYSILEPTPTLSSPTSLPTTFLISPISPISNPTPPPLLSTTNVLSPSIEQVIVGQSQDDYKIQVTAFNSLNEDLLVTHLKIGHIVTKKPDPQDVTCRAVEPPVREPPIEYDILGNILITGVKDNEVEFRSEISPSGELSGYTYSGQGKVFEGCIDESVNPRRQYRLELNFETSFLLSKNTYTNFFITIPKQFDSRNGNVESENSEPMSLKYSFVEPEQPENFEENDIVLELLTNFSYSLNYTLSLLP